jgi:hypothetical protein
VSFLKFLLSRERSIEVFCEGKRSKRWPPTIEVYPKGFVPSHFRNRENARSNKEQGHTSKIPDQESGEQTGQTTAEETADTVE